MVDKSPDCTNFMMEGAVAITLVRLAASKRSSVGFLFGWTER